MLTDIQEGSNTIEECCEFTIACPVKGLPAGGGSKVAAKFEDT
jgi:hypothetical protein